MVWCVTYNPQLTESDMTDAPTATTSCTVHDSSCCCLSQDRRERVRTPRAGTVEKLAEHLAPFRTELDVSYRTCFLATYRTFMSAARLIELLKERSGAANYLPIQSLSIHSVIRHSCKTSLNVSCSILMGPTQPCKLYAQHTLLTYDSVCSLFALPEFLAAK